MMEHMMMTGNYEVLLPCQVVAKNQSDSALYKFIIIMFDDTIYSLLTENSVNQIVFFTDSLNV